MKHTHQCPKCGSGDIALVPDTAHRTLANSICITRHAWVKRIPVERHVCCACGYVENWASTKGGLQEILAAYQ